VLRPASTSGRDPTCTQKQKSLFNLETHEFGINPPFLKNFLPFQFPAAKTVGTEVKKMAGNVSLLLVGTGALKKIQI
jgi:hypothetical protein